MMFFVFLDGFADKRAVAPNFSLMNQQSLDKILKAEVFVHTNGQLRAAHLILDYISISKTFQAPKCVIKARDPHLQRISVAALGFLITGPIPEGRGVHGLGWVGLRGFFDPTHHGGSKKIQPNQTHHISPTQPNPNHMGRVEPMGLTNFFYYY